VSYRQVSDYYEDRPFDSSTAVEALKARDEEKFCNSMFPLCSHLIQKSVKGYSHIFEDLVSECLLKLTIAFRGGSIPDEPARLYYYCSRIIINCCYDKIAEERSLREIPESYEPQYRNKITSVVKLVSIREFRDNIEEFFLKTITEKCRFILPDEVYLIIFRSLLINRDIPVKIIKHNYGLYTIDKMMPSLVVWSRYVIYQLRQQYKDILGDKTGTLPNDDYSSYI